MQAWNVNSKQSIWTKYYGLKGKSSTGGECKHEVCHMCEVDGFPFFPSFSSRFQYISSPWDLSFQSSGVLLYPLFRPKIYSIRIHMLTTCLSNQLRCRRQVVRFVYSAASCQLHIVFKRLFRVFENIFSHQWINRQGGVQQECIWRENKLCK